LWWFTECFDESEAPAKLELNVGIVRDHVVYEFGDARIVRARRVVARNDEFSELIEELVFGGCEELELVRGGLGRLRFSGGETPAAEAWELTDNRHLGEHF
jgi:hypothetical protein